MKKNNPQGLSGNPRLRRSWHYASPPFAVVAPLANNDIRDFAKKLHNSYFSSVFTFFTKL